MKPLTIFLTTILAPAHLMAAAPESKPATLPPSGWDELTAGQFIQTVAPIEAAADGAGAAQPREERLTFGTGNESPFDVEVQRRLIHLGYNHKGFHPAASDFPELLAAMNDARRDRYGRLCVASALLDLNQEDARSFIANRLRGADKKNLHNAAYALLFHARNKMGDSWAVEQMMATLKDDRLFVPTGSVEQNESSDAMNDFCRQLGDAGEKAAIGVLKGVLERHSCENAAYALGRLGDRSAVPLIIKCDSKNNRHLINDALGRLATPEAVDFLLAHLEDDGAPRALAMTRSDKALPALQARLAWLKMHKDELDTDLMTADVQVAILELANNPAEALLQVGQDPKQNYQLRRAALMAMHDHDVASLWKRIVRLYEEDADCNIKRFCIWLLDDVKEPSITDFMIDHALLIAGEEKNRIDRIATESELLRVLNQRLGVDYVDLEHLVPYLHQLRNPASAK